MGSAVKWKFSMMMLVRGTYTERFVLHFVAVMATAPHLNLCAHTLGTPIQPPQMWGRRTCHSRSDPSFHQLQLRLRWWLFCCCWHIIIIQRPSANYILLMYTYIFVGMYAHIKCISLRGTESS